MCADHSTGPDPARTAFAEARDGTRVSYRVFPGASPTFLNVNTPGAPWMGVRASMPAVAGGPTREIAFAQYLRGRRGIWFDWRGAGASDPIEEPIGIEDLVSDLEAITAVAGEPVDARAFGRACFPVFLHAAERPDRYRSIHVEGAALRPDEGWQGLYSRPGWEAHYSEHLRGIVAHYHGLSHDAQVNIALRWERRVPAAAFAAYLEAERGVDLTEVLPRVEVPTWVTARLPINYEPAAKVAALLPNSILSIYEPPATGSDFLRDEWDRNLGTLLGDPPSTPLDEAPVEATKADEDVRITPRERDVLALVAAGDTNRQISASLGIAEGTVKRHISNLLQKTGVSNRRHLMRFSDRHHLLD